MIVKICGITNVDDAMAAFDAGADWIGLNMVAGPRKIEWDVVREILARLPDPNRAVVLVSVDQAVSQPCATFTPHSSSAPLLDQLFGHGVRRLQLYGDVTHETLSDLHKQGFETIFVHHVDNHASLDKLNVFLFRCESACPNYILFDAADPKQLGGTGRRANWACIAEARNDGRGDHWPPFLLAGGLTPENVAVAVQGVRPAGVDVSSGVEASPGRKDISRLRRFVAQARAE